MIFCVQVCQDVQKQQTFPSNRFASLSVDEHITYHLLQIPQ